MCGIVGIISLDNNEPIDSNELDRFTDSLTHRGPDGRGTYINKSKAVGLGHRRLSILDLTEAGRQPMSYSNNRYWITYNGEVFNFLELKDILKEKGYIFKTNSDTEIILASYQEWGKKCLNKFNGMWSIAIWDEKEKELFIARDRFGEKPLYYFKKKNKFFFASELKAFIKLNVSNQPKIDDSRILWSSLPSKSTFLENVYNLEPGSYLTLRKNITKIERWWDINQNVSPKSETNYMENCEKFSDLFKDACKIRMRSDVPFASAVSGGLDSSAVFSAIYEILRSGDTKDRILQNNYTPFFLRYLNSKNDESDYVKKLVDNKSVNPEVVEIDTNDIDPKDLIYTTYSFEGIQEPHFGPWKIYKEMKKNGFSVSLDGHGADELLGGYMIHLESALKDGALNFRSNRFKEIKTLIQNVKIPDQKSQFLKSNRAGVIVKILFEKIKLMKFFNILLKKNDKLLNLYLKLKKILLAKIFKKKFYFIKQPIDFKRSKIKKPFSKDIFNRKLYESFHYETLPRILNNIDKFSMASGVEVRSPFLDYRLVKFLFSLPQSFKLDSRYSKKILRDSLKNILPVEIYNRQSKYGFSTPMDKIYSKKFEFFVKDLICSQSFKQINFFDTKEFTSSFFNKNIKKDGVYMWKNLKFIQAHILKEQFKKNSFI